MKEYPKKYFTTKMNDVCVFILKYLYKDSSESI